MKRYVKASYRRSQDWQGMVDAIKHDIRVIARCNDEADLAAADIHSSNPNAIKHIWNEHAENKGMDFDEKIDYILDYLYQSLQYFKEELDRKQQETNKADNILFEIENYLRDNQFNFETDVDHIYVYPLYRSRDELIRFIDGLIAELGGRYFGTGRGGSWTSWNILIDGIEFQIGPDDYKDCWLIREV